MQKGEKWTETYIQLLKAEQKATLQPKDLLTLSLAAYLIGKNTRSFQILEKAHQAYLDLKKPERALRCAFWLGLMLMDSGEMVRSGGWIARGERLLREENLDCAEKGLFMIPAALGALSSGNAGKARKLFEQAATIGEKFKDPDLTTLARLGIGQAMIVQGEVENGIKLLDEIMISIEKEEIFPMVKGIVFCAVIETCSKVWDLRRAREWTLALTRWCDAHPDMVPFRGQCLVSKAEIARFHGEWSKALTETRKACELLTQPPGKPAAGNAFYLEGDLHRLQGDFEKAEACYREAAKWGKKPQPGLALLRLAQGQETIAETSIGTALQETNDKGKRAGLLYAAVGILIAVGQKEKALEVVEELYDIAREIDTPFLYAMASYGRGAVFFAEGKVQPALEQLQYSLQSWNSLQLPYELALSCELMGLIYRELNDSDNCDVELGAARSIFNQLHALPDLERVNRLMMEKDDLYGLTARELQVLQWVASGKTNKTIAGELFISERTVDRHVSNIFNKLGVSSRVEATTFGLRNNILHTKP